VVLLAAAACARSGTLRIALDSTTVPGAVEVLAAPVDPVLLIVNDPARHAADSLQAAFQRARLRLNARADSLDRSDRRTPAYASAFAAFNGDAAGAESLRARRDSLRLHEGPVRALAVGELAKEAAAAGRDLARAKLVNERASFTLREGTWWIIALGKRGETVGTPRKVEVIADKVDTLRITN
jgi:hypothetical protein